MAPNAIEAVVALVATLRLAECQALARAVLDATCVEQVRALRDQRESRRSEVRSF